MPVPRLQQEGVGQADQYEVGMSALPASPFAVVQTQSLFRPLAVRFHPLAQFSQVHQPSERGAMDGSESQGWPGASTSSGHSNGNQKGGSSGRS